MRRSRLGGLVVVVALVGAGCTTRDADGGDAPPSPAAEAAQVAESRNGQIPAFSAPTEITNPYLPLAQGGRWIYEGTKEGEPYLVEVAVTPERKTVEGTETLVVRHRGWVGGVLIEEARDYYAQGDDGGVWYFGEDVANFEDGELVDNDGTWLAGRDGALPALLLPAEPTVGQVFYSEDIADLDIVERDEVLALDHPAETPEGPADGLLLGATQPDGTEEEKVFVQGVGEVLARSDEGEVRLTQRLADGAESATEALFSDPTTVDNPWFGVTGVDHRLYFGVDEGQPIRIETTLTGDTRTVEWEGGSTEVVVSQFVETSGRDLLETAVDWFAQDDDGNVWYFGEDVFNYDEGRVADTEGTWVAGEDGPPGLIMPGQPTLGQRFNPENIPGVVFETVDVQEVGDVLQLHETLADGVEETKRYERGRGNVTVEIPGVETVELVYALPDDAIAAAAPPELTAALAALRAGAVDAGAVRQAVEDFAASGEPAPPALLDLVAEQLDALDRDGDAGAAADLELTVLDLLRLYRTDRPVDLDLLDLQARRLLTAVAEDDAAAAGVAAALAAAIAERNHDIDPALAAAAAAVDTAMDDQDLPAAATAAENLRAAL